jgi:uncharacterized protein YecE (DUF72 family)
MAKIHIGLSGFTYKPWRGEGRFYPAKLKEAEFLPFYAERYPAVEMNGSWMMTPSEASIARYIETSPDNFKFTFKAHRNITHIGRLKPETADLIQPMLDRLKPMQDAGKLGSIFFQLPPNLKRDDAKLEAFLTRLPKGAPYSMEFRNESWFHDDVEAMLRAHNVSWVSWDTDEIAGQRRDTGSHIYVRLRRETYTDAQLADWAQWLMKQDKDSFVFFKHEDDGSPWLDANRLIALLPS